MKKRVGSSARNGDGELRLALRAAAPLSCNAGPPFIYVLGRYGARSLLLASTRRQSLAAPRRRPALVVFMLGLFASALVCLR